MKARKYKKRTARRDEILRRIAGVLNEKTESSENSAGGENSVKKALDNADK